MNNYKLWKDMTPEEKGALLLAHHEGKMFEVSDLLPGNEWMEIKRPNWFDKLAYRVKLETRTEVLYWESGQAAKQRKFLSDTHKITITLEGNKPVDIKIEEIQ